MNTLISENEDPPVLDPIEQAEEEEEEGVDVDQENVDSEEDGSSDMSTMSTKELMKTLSDIEQMIDQPLEIDDQ